MDFHNQTHVQETSTSVGQRKEGTRPCVHHYCSLHFTSLLTVVFVLVSALVMNPKVLTPRSLLCKQQVLSSFHGIGRAWVWCQTVLSSHPTLSLRGQWFSNNQPLNLSEPQFPLLQNGNNKDYLSEGVQLREMMCVRQLDW